MKSQFVLVYFLGSAVFASPLVSSPALEASEPTCSYEASWGKNSSQTDFTVLYLEADPSLVGQTSNLVSKILSADADVVCIQEIADEEYACTLRDALERQYAHFAYVPQLSSERYLKGGSLIVSKYSMDMGQIKGDCFDFIIKNADKSLGHIYVASGAPSVKFTQIVEKMQNDFLTRGEESMPFFLCGNLGSLKRSQASKSLIEAYFYEGNNKTNSSALLLQALPSFPHEWVSAEYTISTLSVGMVAEQLGLLTTVKRAASDPVNNALKDTARKYLDENGIVLSKGEVTVSGSADKEGNASAKASVSVSDRSDSGSRTSAGVSVEVFRDKEGDVDAKATAKVTYEWGS